MEGTSSASSDGRRKVSYCDTVLGDSGRHRPTGFEEMADGKVSDDDLIEESSDTNWFGLVWQGKKKSKHVFLGVIA